MNVHGNLLQTQAIATTNNKNSMNYRNKSKYLKTHHSQRHQTTHTHCYCTITSTITHACGIALVTKCKFYAEYAFECCCAAR